MLPLKKRKRKFIFLEAEEDDEDEQPYLTLSPLFITQKDWETGDWLALYTAIIETRSPSDVISEDTIHNLG